MDVPSRDEFEKLQNLLEALCRYLNVSPVYCDSHQEFSAKVYKAIKNCDTVESFDCPECGASFKEKTPMKFQKNDIT